MEKRENNIKKPSHKHINKISPLIQKLRSVIYAIKNCSYHRILLAISLIAFGTIGLWIGDLCTHFIPWDSNEGLFEAVGILCQVITSIITCVISVLGISFSIQDYEKFGVKIRDLLTLREDKHFSFLCSLLISFSLVICNVVALIFKWYFLCFGSAIISIILCFYVLIIEIPYLHAQENTLHKVLKNYLLVHSSDLTFTEPFTTAVTTLVRDNDLINVYYILSNHSEKKCSYNRRLLNLLLNVQEDLARNVQYVEDRLEAERTTHRILDVLIDIISGTFNLSKIVDDDFVNYDNQIIRTMYFLSKRSNPCYQSVAKAVAQLICFSRSDNLSALHISFKHRILLSMVAIPIHNREYSVIEEIKTQYSQLSMLLNEHSDSTLMFALISMFLYYMIAVEQDVSDEWRTELKNVIEFSGVVNNTKVESWKALFACFAEFFPVDSKEFLETFKENRSQMEFMLYTGGMHECRFYDDFGLKWYLTHYINSYNVLPTTDFAKEFSYITNSSVFRFYFKDFCKQIFAEQKFKPTQEMFQMTSFWGDRGNTFQNFTRCEDVTHSLENFYHKLIIEDEEKQNSNAPTTTAIDYIPKLKQDIENSLQAEWGFDSNLSAPNNHKKGMDILILQRANLEETITALSNSLTRSIFYEIRKMCQPAITSIPIVSSKMDETILQELLQSEVAISVGDAPYYDCFIKDVELKGKYQALCNHVSHKESSIFRSAFITNKGFRFNVFIDLLEKYDLTDQQFNNIVERYRRSDGQYFYEGVFMNRDEVARCLKNKYHVLTMEIRIALEVKTSEIYEFNFESSNS